MRELIITNNETYSTTVINSKHVEDQDLLMSESTYNASAFVLLLIGFFGFSLNLTVILLMFRDKHLWTPLNVILFNLVFGDFLVSILGNPWTFISALYHRWIFGSVMCQIYGFFMAWLVAQ
ncbi:melanopsin isoform X4 [Agrilus planipennis]|uniref:Melanopsin isoform X4 n=1 Tax=Agrilus planipennis TaxID=224129 RepID=A0A1W4W735_AGRPL|nr:melanopsin isoform X4 [Agrilus planipennis]